ncbi:MAG: hypothetical protein EXS47_01740 [Candidatus Zambryskibacteria bacterium]|nr:hypothetical protein [Candidatus Zambryskibacteria bacterium]
MSIFQFLLPFLAVLIGVMGLVHLRRGALFVPSRREAVEKMVNLLDIKHGERAVDLGSGDGRIVIALARAGAEAHGYEHNLLLVWWSRLAIKRAGLGGRAFIHRTNFWKEDFSKFTVFTVFGINYIMKKLEEKLFREVSRGRTRVASYVFKFPKIAHSLSSKGVYLYNL